MTWIKGFFALLLVVTGPVRPVEGSETLWLEKAEIAVHFESEHSREVEQQIFVSSEAPILEFRIEHSLFLDNGESIRDVSVTSDEGSASVVVEGRGLSTVLRVAVVSNDGEAFDQTSYRLEMKLEVESASRCPLGVPKIVPLDPHNPVRIEVHLPPGRVASGMVFPKLEIGGDRLVGGMGGVPSFVNVPNGARKPSWFARNAIDGSILIFIIASTGLWLRSRKTDGGEH